MFLIDSLERRSDRYRQTVTLTAHPDTVTIMLGQTILIGVYQKKQKHMIKSKILILEASTLCSFIHTDFF